LQASRAVAIDCEAARPRGLVAVSGTGRGGTERERHGSGGSGRRPWLAAGPGGVIGLQEPIRRSVLERLTPEQERLLSVVRDEWLRVGVSTEPADRAGAEAGVRLAYQTAGLPSPRAVIWLDSPLLGVIAAVMLEPAGVDQWERARTQLRARAGE